MVHQRWHMANAIGSIATAFAIRNNKQVSLEVVTLCLCFGQARRSAKSIAWSRGSMISCQRGGERT